MALAHHSFHAWPDEPVAAVPRRPAARIAAFEQADPATSALERACAAIDDLRQRRVQLERDASARQERFATEIATANEAVSLWRRRTEIMAEQLDDSQDRLADLEEIIASATRRIDHAEASLTRLERTAEKDIATVHLYHDRILAAFGTMDLG